jgi:gamma-glutamylcyclotransferase (GGCT)/AIG2-like uncharacterized protein YtfP
MDRSRLVFVYGTLKRGHHNHHHMTHPPGNIDDPLEFEIINKVFYFIIIIRSIH